MWSNIERTVQLVAVEQELHQIHEVADRRRDGACAPQQHAGTFHDWFCLRRIDATQDAPFNLFMARWRYVSFVRFPIDAGMAPADHHESRDVGFV